LTPVPLGAGVLGYRDPVEQTLAAGRALLRGNRQSLPATHASAPPGPPDMTIVPEGDLATEQIEAWTRELFPETRAGAGARKGRITTDAKYARGMAA
jgi:hypothetical protein